MYLIENKDDLLKTHAEYKEHIDLWNFYYTSYKGGKDLIEAVIKKHPRESIDNFDVRKSECFSINYNSAIIDLLSYHLTDNAVENFYGELNNDEAWNLFLKDADLFETDFNVYLNEVQKLSAIFGAVGVLVDKPYGNFDTKKQELDNLIRPYVTTYTLPNILDWTYGINQFGKASLIFLKLKNFYDEYIVWYENFWQAIKLTHKNELEIVREGENPLGEIPFRWLYNLKDPLNPMLGVSDIKEICYINAAMMRNFSCANEILKFSAFPILRKPLSIFTQEETETVVSENSILEFNPEWGEGGKADWLQSVAKEPLEAIMMYEDQLINEIYRIAHLNGIRAAEVSSQAKSGIALRIENAQLGALLAKKSRNLAEFTHQIIRLWLKWQNQSELMDQVSVEPIQEFGLDESAVSIDIATKIIELIPSDKFKQELLKSMLRRVMPNLDNRVKKEIDDEIETFKSMENDSEENIDTTQE